MNFPDILSGGLLEYGQRVKHFTLNARWLIMSQAIRHFGVGVSSAIFNLFLLTLGYNNTFLGDRLFLGYLVFASAALATGPVCRKISAKTAIILGDIIIAITALVQTLLPFHLLLLLGEMLNKLGDACLKDGLLNAAIEAYTLAGNEMMTKFIKENF